jgi:hypothetical protein
MVQRMARPPTEAATAINTVRVVLFVFEASDIGAEMDVSSAASTDCVRVMVGVTVLTGVLSWVTLMVSGDGVAEDREVVVEDTLLGVDENDVLEVEDNVVEVEEGVSEVDKVDKLVEAWRDEEEEVTGAAELFVAEDEIVGIDSAGPPTNLPTSTRRFFMKRLFKAT